MRTFTLPIALIAAMAPAVAQADRVADLAMVAAYAFVQKDRCAEAADMRVCNKFDALTIWGKQDFSYTYIPSGQPRTDPCFVYYVIIDESSPFIHLNCGPHVYDKWIVQNYKEDARDRLRSLLDRVIEDVRKRIEATSHPC